MEAISFLCNYIICFDNYIKCVLDFQKNNNNQHVNSKTKIKAMVKLLINGSVKSVQNNRDDLLKT